MAKRASKARPKQQKPASRWITVHARFDYRWPSGAITHFSDRDLGEHRVKNELADFAVGKGYASEGKLEEQSPAEAADSGSDDAVARESVADADRTADRQQVAPDAE